MEVFYSVLALLGGLAMFLYGMNLMGDGLKRSSGGAMKAALGKVTNNQVIGFIFGMLVTCMIQSSTATIVLTVGLVGAGLLTFHQSIGIVLGANVGTAITAQIIRLMDVSAGETSLLYLFKADNLAPIALIIGIILVMFLKNDRLKVPGNTLVGFGILFMGLIFMSDAVSGMGDRLTGLLLAFEDNYILGFLSGVVVTGVIQSSSAVVGILQSLASSVGVEFCGVFAIIIGVNIGDCLTTFLVSRIGAKPDQIRTATVHVIYNIFAAVMIAAVLAILRSTGVLDDEFWYRTLNSGGVANVHGVFRLVPAVVLLPLSGVFERMARKLVKDKPIPEEDADIEANLRELDSKLVSNPTIAFSQTETILGHMADTALHNYEACVDQIYAYDEGRRTRIGQRENLLDRMADAANQYVIDISPFVTLDRESQIQSFQIRALTCFERIGDLAVNIAQDVINLRANDDMFSEEALIELRVGTDAVREILALTNRAFKENDLTAARHVEPLEEVIDELIEELKARHIDRMKEGRCGIYTGIQYENVLSNLERVSDQCSDLAVAILSMGDAGIAGKEHEYVHYIHHANDPDYMDQFRDNIDEYFGRLGMERTRREQRTAAAQE